MGSRSAADRDLTDEFLDPPTRRRIADLVRARPGMTMSSVGRELSIAWGVLAHHLHTLARQERVVMLPARGRMLLFPAPARSVEGLASAAALQGTARTVALAILRSPGTSAAEVQMETGLSRRCTYYHVQRLLEEKLVTSEGPRCHRDLRPTPALVRWVDLAEAKEEAR